MLNFKKSYYWLRLTPLLLVAACSDSDYDQPQINTPPQANALSVNTVTDTMISAQLSASDADNDYLGYTLVESPSYGEVVVNADGSFIYSPQAEYVGADSFTFQVNDGYANSQPAQVDIAIATKQEMISSYTRTAFNKSETDNAEGVNGREFTDDVMSTDEFQDLVDNGSQ